MLSGRSTAVMSKGEESAKAIVRRCCSRLQIQGSDTEKLVHGTEVVPATALVSKTKKRAPASKFIRVRPEYIYRK
eukprot:1568255-Amphidinium_carterae.1